MSHGWAWTELVGLRCNTCGATLWAIQRPDGTFSNETLVCPVCDVNAPAVVKRLARAHSGG